MSVTAPQYFNGPNGRIAYRTSDGDGPTLVWLGGLYSDMLGSKATFLDEWSRKRNIAFLRFDYSGHGESDGAFDEGCISDWRADAQAVIEAKTDGPLILIGSSMGGWITCLLAETFKNRLAGVVFIAPAPDFTSELMAPAFSEEDRAALARDGRINRHSDYEGEAPMPITKHLIDDGAQNRVLDKPVAIDAPVRILQGMADPDVPYPHALRLAEALTSDDVQISLTKTGDHRLSSPSDLDRLGETLAALVTGL